MTGKYCYWSVATKEHAALMRNCVDSARDSGVSKEFHVLTDQDIKGAACYDAHDVDLTDGFFKLIYLKAAIIKLSFDYFVWLDADTLFLRNPAGMLAVLGKAPMHVPLLEEMSLVGVDTPAPGPTFPSLARKAGINNPYYTNESSFWIVSRGAVDVVCKLCGNFRALCGAAGLSPSFSECLGYAMQMLCGNPAPHRASARPDLWSNRPDLWTGDLADTLATRILPQAAPASGSPPAILHLGRSRFPRPNAGDSPAQQEGNGAP